MIRVITVCPSETITIGMKCILSKDSGILLVAQFASMAEALVACQETIPDVALIALPKFDYRDYSAAQTLSRKYKVNLVAYAPSSEPEFAAIWTASGGVASIRFDSGSEEIIEVVKKAAQGDSSISPTIKRFAGDMKIDSKLSGREREVLQLIAMGYTQNDIAARLFISRKTVETHRARIGRKLGADNRTELVRYAMVNGLVNPGL